MIVPMRRGELERFRPHVLDVRSLPKVAANYRFWRKGRSRFIQELGIRGSDAQRLGWQRHYVQGRNEGIVAPNDHQTNLQLAAFTQEST